MFGIDLHSFQPATTVDMSDMRREAEKRLGKDNFDTYLNTLLPIQLATIAAIIDPSKSVVKAPVPDNFGPVVTAEIRANPSLALDPVVCSHVYFTLVVGILRQMVPDVTHVPVNAVDVWMATVEHMWNACVATVDVRTDCDENDRRLVLDAIATRLAEDWALPAEESEFYSTRIEHVLSTHMQQLGIYDPTNRDQFSLAFAELCSNATRVTVPVNDEQTAGCNGECVEEGGKCTQRMCHSGPDVGDTVH